MKRETKTQTVTTVTITFDALEVIEALKRYAVSQGVIAESTSPDVGLESFWPFDRSGNVGEQVTELLQHPNRKVLRLTVKTSKNCYGE